jgi:hypothetical protein
MSQTTAHEGGPAAVAYLTALLNREPDIARDILTDLTPEQVSVAFTALGATVFGLLQAISKDTMTPYTELRDALLADIGTSLAEAMSS